LIQIRRQKGFTLLEVLVAITLTALVMGSVFSLQSQSNRLAYQSSEKIDDTVNRRAALNLAWMGVKMLDELPYQVESKEALPIPEQLSDKIKDNMLRLEAFDLLDENGEVLHSGVHLKKPKSL